MLPQRLIIQAHRSNVHFQEKEALKNMAQNCASTATNMTISSRYDKQQEPPNSVVKLAKDHKMLTLSSPSQGKDLGKEVFEAIRTLPSCEAMLRSTIVFLASYLRASQTVTQTKSG